MNLEYLMVYQASGLPIFSKCFKGFCRLSAQDPALLSGFLTAIQSFSTQVLTPQGSEKSTLEAVKIGTTIMRFNRVLPSGHNVVIGLTEDSPLMAKEIFDGVEKFIEEKYSEVNWAIIDTTFGEEFGKDLVSTVLAPIFHSKGGWEDQCPLGDACPMKALPTQTETKFSIIETIKNTYRRLWKRKGVKHTI